MGVITVTVDDDVEERFREKLEELDGGKGAMGRAVSEALEHWVRKHEGKKPRWMEIAEEGLELGEIDFDRDKLHER